MLARATGSPRDGSPKWPPYTVWARCGATWKHVANRPLPDDLTGWHSQVTCEGCLDPPSWAEARIPS